MILTFLALACAPDTTTTPAGTPADLYWSPQVLPPVDCDEQEFDEGLTLFGLPSGATVAVSMVDGDQVYTEFIQVDRCGIATPFTSMSVDDFGHFDEVANVYAQVVEDPGYYVYQGIFLSAEPNAPPETPISTQWEWSEEANNWVAIRDPDLGILLGLFVIQ